MPFEDYSQLLEYLAGLQQKGSHLGLERMEKVLEKLGNPERKQKTIHIAGSNGKGSTAAMLESILREAGFRTGLYTSPHLVDVRERFRVNGEKITKSEMMKLAETIKFTNTDLTYFEFLTVLALLHFQKQKTDFSILEVGLGGRLDATNVINPIVSVITSISLEHTRELGDTIESVAKEKAGIIKPGIPVITNNNKGAYETIRKVAETKNSPAIQVENRVKQKNSSLENQIFSYRGKDFQLPLLGKFQLENVSTVLEIVNFLNRNEKNISSKNIREGLEKVSWPGRVEVARRRPLLILDGAHNPAGTGALKQFLEELEYGKMFLVFGCMEDKNYRKMLSHLLPLSNETVLTRAKVTRALNPERLRDSVEDKNGLTVEKDIDKALKTVLEKAGKEDLILVTGSLYLVGNVKELLRSYSKRF